MSQPTQPPQWGPLSGVVPNLTTKLAPFGGLLRAALEEGVSSSIGRPIGLASIQAMRLDGHPSQPPMNFQPAVAFELSGGQPHNVWALLPQPIPDHDVELTTIVERVLHAYGELLVRMTGNQVLKVHSMDQKFEYGNDTLVIQATFSGGASFTLFFAVHWSVAAEISQMAYMLPESPEMVAPVKVAAQVAPPDQVAVTGTSPSQGAVYGGSMRAMEFNDLEAAPVQFRPGELEMIDVFRGVPLSISVELGRTSMPMKDAYALSPNAFIELDKLAGEPVDILANGLLFARGQPVVIGDTFGVQITEIVRRRRADSAPARLDAPPPRADEES